jgi:ATP-binding cassette subfamily B protein
MTAPELHSKYKALRLFVQFLLLHSWMYGLVLLLFFIAGLSINLVPYMTGLLTTAVTTTPIDPGRIWYIAILFITCNLVHWFFWHFAEYIYSRYILKDLFQFDSWVFRQVISREYDYYVNRFSGKISSYLSSLGREFREFVQLLFYDYLQQLIFLPVLLITLWTVNGLTAGIFTVSILIMLYVSKKTLPPVLKQEARATDKSGDVSGIIFDAFSNYVSVKAFKAEHYEERLLREGLSSFAVASRDSYNSSIVFWTALSTIVRVLVWPITTLLNVYLFVNGEIGIGEFSTFLASLILYASLIWSTIFQFSDLSKRLTRANESYSYLFEGAVFDAAPSFAEGPRKLEESPSFRSSIEIRDLEFSYPDAPDIAVLKNLSLSIKKGEKVGVVGRSGSGKTTLIKLLLGYYEVERGTLLIDGAPIERGQLVQLLTYVPQDTALFNRTLRENIAYNLPPALSTQEHLEEAARRSLASEFIDQLPKRFETQVGERGIKLSAGQRQRIAIARALIREKPIIILDEATSALDSESEERIKEAFENLWEGKTVIAIAHRLSTLRNMDRIIVLSKGEIVESGSHDELLAHGGIYKHLWERQSGAMIGEE